MIVDTWYPTVLMITLKYLLVDASKNKAGLHQLYLLGAFLQANLKHTVSLKLDSRYG